MILNHYPPVIKQIKDIQQIAKAEDIEFTKLNTSITEVIRNMFVFTANETGVKRFEKLFRDYAKGGAEFGRSENIYYIHDEPAQNEPSRINGDVIQLFRRNKVNK